MTRFPRFHCKYPVWMFLLSAVFVLFSCEREETEETVVPGSLSVPVEIGVPTSKAIVNNQTHHVNRVLLIPFRKSAENLTDDNVNYIPQYTYALQADVDQFPLNSATLHLPAGFTYKVLVIGYNRTDYDFTNQNSPANRFVLGAVASPVNLGNFHVYPKSATSIPEFFTCVAEVFNGATSMGNTFKPEQGLSLKGTLTRLVSGFSITITDVPGFVKFITLSADNLVKSSRTTDAAPTQWQTTGDGGNRILDKQIPNNGTVTFTQYLLPTFSTYKTGFTLTVGYGQFTQAYSVKTTDATGAVTSNQFIFNPNEAINLTGSYTSINLGFSIGCGIGLDDDKWDGIQ